MGIQRINLGPKSRFAKDVAEGQAAVDQADAAGLLRPGGKEALGDALARQAFSAEMERTQDTVVPRPSDRAVAEAAGLIGCACGMKLLPSRIAVLAEAGVVHRSGRPCYLAGGSKGAGFTRPPGLSIEQRVAAVEAVVLRLVQARGGDRGPTCVCGCSWVEHQGHVTSAWTLEAGACLSCACTQFVAATANTEAPSHG